MSLSKKFKAFAGGALSPITFPVLGIGGALSTPIAMLAIMGAATSLGTAAYFVADVLQSVPAIS